MVELRILSTMALVGVLKALAPGFEAARGVRLDAEFQPTQRLIGRIGEGETADVAILTDKALDDLVASGVLTGRTDLARSYVGVAVRAGVPHPDISTREAFVATLLAAKSVGMSQAGASGIFFAALLDRLGIADQVRAKAIVLPSGYTAELAASGKAEIAVQQVSELMAVPGVEIVGRLPPELGGSAIFGAGVFAQARQPGLAAALIAALAGSEREPLYRQCGLEQTGRQRASGVA